MHAELTDKPGIVFVHLEAQELLGLLELHTAPSAFGRFHEAWIGLLREAILMTMREGSGAPALTGSRNVDFLQVAPEAPDDAPDAPIEFRMRIADQPEVPLEVVEFCSRHKIDTVGDWIEISAIGWPDEVDAGILDYLDGMARSVVGQFPAYAPDRS